jgi:phosphoglycerate kinase
LIKHNPKSIVLLSHLGRPNGKKSDKFSLKPIVGELEKHLNKKVIFLDDCVTESVINTVKNSKNNEIYLCENVRFHIEEEGSTKDKDGKKIKAEPEKVKQFQEKLTQLGDCYVNDAFGTAHRAHSSVVGVKHKYRVAGLLMQKELNFLGNFVEKPKKPVVAVLGGSKISDKINLVKNMLNFADEIIFGGGMKNPFLTEVFKRKLGATFNMIPENPKQLSDIVEEAKRKGVTLHFPKDYKVAKQKEMKKPSKVIIMNEN